MSSLRRCSPSCSPGPRALALSLALLFTTGVAACADDGGAGAGAPGDAAQEPAPSERVLRLLTRFEYDNTVRDLLGVQSRHGQDLPPEDVALNGGFDNNARALRVGPLMADRLQAAAEALADEVLGDLPRLLPCQPAQRGEEACVRQLLTALGPRAFRRPFSDGDLGRYLALYRTVAAAAKAAGVSGYEEGLRAVVSALLQSPHFLYRSELGEAAGQGEGALWRLTQHELASELSYLLWGSMPDDELLGKADAGKLQAPADLEAEARRLLAAPRARAQLDHFLGQWLLLDRLPNAAKDEKTYPELTADLRGAMREEAREFFDSAIRAGKARLPELLSARHSFASDGLARFYGLPAPAGPRTAAGFGRVELPAGRGGLLTLGALLTTQATPHSGSPIHRGKLVRERLLCHALPPPPPGLVVQLPEVDPRLSNRERFAAHATDVACASCHRLMDPIGLGFEHFDGIGRWRDSDAGKPVDARGELLSARDAGPFDGVAELAARLGQSREVQDCFARTLTRFAYGVEGELLSPLADEAAARFQGADLVVAELLVQLTQLPRVRERRPDPDVSGAPAVDAGAPPDLSPGPGPEPPPTPFTAALRRDSDWATGYCATVTVKNGGAEQGEWRVTLMIEGTLNNLWNARSAPAAAGTEFTGMDYNKTLAAGASTSFGFCAAK